MRRTLPLVIIAASLAFAGEARADDDLEMCAGEATDWLNKKPALKSGPDVAVVSPIRLVYRCRTSHGLPEAFVAAVRGKRGWSITKLGQLYCARLEVNSGAVLIKHADACPARYYHQNACVDMRSRVAFGKRGPKLTRLSSKRRLACRHCPDSTDVGCVKRARAAARELFDAGKVREAARLLRAVLDHVSDYAINSEGQWVDPWAVNDALLYSARAKIRCDHLALTWRDHAIRTARSRKAFIANSRRCKRIQPKR